MPKKKRYSSNVAENKSASEDIDIAAQYQAFTYDKIKNYWEHLFQRQHPNYAYHYLKNNLPHIASINTHYLTIEGPLSYKSTINKASYYVIDLPNKYPDTIKNKHLSIVSHCNKNNDKQCPELFKATIHYSIYTHGGVIRVYTNILNKNFRTCDPSTYIIKVTGYPSLRFQQNQLKQQSFLYIKPLQEKIITAMTVAIKKLTILFNQIVKSKPKNETGKTLLTNDKLLEKLINFRNLRIKFAKLYSEHISPYEACFSYTFPQEMFDFKPVYRLYIDNKNKINSTIKYLQREKKINSLKYNKKKSDNNKNISFSQSKKSRKHVNQNKKNLLFIKKLFYQNNLFNYQLDVLLDQLINSIITNDMNLFEKNLKLIFDLKKSHHEILSLLVFKKINNFYKIIFMCAKPDNIKFLDIFCNEIFINQDQLNNNTSLKTLHLLTMLIIVETNWQGLILLNNKVKEKLKATNLDAILVKQTKISIMFLLFGWIFCQSECWNPINHDINHIKNPVLRRDKQIYMINKYLYFFEKLKQNNVELDFDYRLNKPKSYKVKNQCAMQIFHSAEIHILNRIANIVQQQQDTLLQESLLNVMISLLTTGQVKDRYQKYTIESKNYYNKKKYKKKSHYLAAMTFILITTTKKLSQDKISSQTIEKIAKLLDIIILIIINNSNDKIGNKKYVVQMQQDIYNNMQDFIGLSIISDNSIENLLHKIHIAIQILAETHDLRCYLQNNDQLSIRNLAYLTDINDILKKTNKSNRNYMVTAYYSLMMLINYFQPNYNDGNIFKKINVISPSLLENKWEKIKRQEIESFIDLLGKLTTIQEIPEISHPLYNVKACNFISRLTNPARDFKMYFISIYNMLIQAGKIKDDNLHKFNRLIKRFAIRLLDKLKSQKNNKKTQGRIFGFKLLTSDKKDNVASNSNPQDNRYHNVYLNTIIQGFYKGDKTLPNIVKYHIGAYLMNNNKVPITLFKNYQVVPGDDNKNKLIPIENDSSNNDTQLN